MGKGVEKKKKKKGRPSLLDIQKRNLKLQQEEQQNLQTNPNSKPTSISPHRRSTRRNPNPDGIPDEDDDDDDDEQEGNPRQRKLNHVLRAPPNQRSSVNSPYLDLGLYGSDSNEEGDYIGETPLKKQKMNAVGSDKKGEKHKSVWKATEKQPLGDGTSLVSGPTTPLPDKQLLFFILDRLQKKDTYGVYSEPVDPNELPDYHEIIENPMDFGTVRKKVENGAYTSLEQFEHDVFLISSNAMQYNAPDSIYFRQARTIHELAKKNFENLRRDSDTEQEPKIVRRGRPPKNLKKLLGKSSSDHDGLDATPIKGEDNAAWSNSYNLRKGRLPDKYASVETSKRATQGPRNSEAYSWLPEHKFDKNDEFSGSSLKGMKYGKKQFVLDESRRNTYNNSHPSVGSELSVLNTFDGEVKQLLPVGLHSELGYARSLARFAANLGPVAWKVASKKIERALPPGMKFGPGWVGDDEAPPTRTSSLTIASPCPLPQQQPTASNQLLSSATGPCMVEPNGERLLRHEFINKSSLDDFPDKIIPSTITPYSTVISRSLEAIGEPVEAVTRTSDSGLGLLSNSSGGVRPSIQIHQSPLIDPDLNGCSNGFGGNPSSQAGPGWSVGNIGTDASVHSRIFDMVSKSNFINSTHGKTCELQNPRQPSAGNSVMGLQDCQAGAGVDIHPQPGWNGLIPQQKPDLIHPDLNVRFQSTGSSNSSVRVDSPQPDLALQL